MPQNSDVAEGTKKSSTEAMALAFGRKIKQPRERGGMSQEDVAASLSVGRAAYSHFERGVNLITLEHLLRLPTVFECTLLAHP